MTQRDLDLNITKLLTQNRHNSTTFKRFFRERRKGEMEKKMQQSLNHSFQVSSSESREHIEIRLELYCIIITQSSFFLFLFFCFKYIFKNGGEGE